MSAYGRVFLQEALLLVVLLRCAGIDRHENKNCYYLFAKKIKAPIYDLSC